MSGILANMRCGECLEGQRRNNLASVIAGTLFFSGWWIILDVAALNLPSFHKTYYLCGVFATVALFMINAISNSQLRGEVYTTGCMGPQGAKLWLFFGFVMGFASMIAAGWILVAAYLIPRHPDPYPGIALLVQNICIFFSGLIYKFGRIEDPWLL